MTTISSSHQLARRMNGKYFHFNRNVCNTAKLSYCDWYHFMGDIEDDDPKNCRKENMCKFYVMLFYFASWFSRCHSMGNLFPPSEGEFLECWKWLFVCIRAKLASRSHKPEWVYLTLKLQAHLKGDRLSSCVWRAQVNGSFFKLARYLTQHIP